MCVCVVVFWCCVVIDCVERRRGFAFVIFLN